MSSDNLRILVLTREQADFLRYGAMLQGHGDFIPELTWCPDPDDVGDLLRNAHFDVLLWEPTFHAGSESGFLQYLAVAGNDKPVVAIGGGTEDLMMMNMLAGGAADYLCKGRLDRWAMARSVRYVWFRQQLQDNAGGQLGREVAS